MRVAVIGATGNVGTAVLSALHRRPEVTSVLGIARRLPETSAQPYRGAEWAAVDIGAATTAEESIEQLAGALRGADAVIHLAWLIQPNTHRDLLRRVNVEGTRHVAQAAVAAGAGTLVVASSVGAYSPSPGPERRDETWPTGGVRTSHYSVDKVAQEQVLDEVAAAHPALTVTRLRPALIFQGEAGSEIQRYFLGGWMPVQLLRAGRPPLVPLPRGLRLQVVHAQDVAEADAGWLGMGMNAPVMDSSRAQRLLGWQPRHSAAETLAELLEGMAEGRGADSVPMRPRDSRRARVAGARRTAGEGGGEGAEVSSRIDETLLGLYLSDHLTGATAGAARVDRMAADFADTPVYATLSTLAEQIRAERRLLQQLIDDLGLRRRPARQAAAWLGEHAGRLKANGRLVRRSPMTMVLETELLRCAVIGKRGGWQTLAENADELGLDATVFHELAEQALRQHEQLDEVHAHARRRAFRADRGTRTPQG